MIPGAVFAEGETMDRRKLWIVALLSMTLISLEVLWTRIFSAEFFYTFAFLVLSLAILGLGLGALAHRLFPHLGKPASLAGHLLAATLMGLLGPAIVLHLELKFSQIFQSPEMIGKFIATLLVLGIPFFAGGVALAQIFSSFSREMPKIYMADLVGAGLGPVLAVLSMNLLGTPLAAVVACVPMGAAAVLATGRRTLIHLFLVGLFGTAALFSAQMLEVERKELGPVLFEHWDAMGKLKVHGMSPDYWNLNIDNVANSPVHRFDGDWEGPLAKKQQFLFEVETLMKERPGFTAVSVGSGGGSEVLQAILAGAGEVYAAEVNPAINRMMTEGELLDFSGRIYLDPRVHVVTEDARTFLRRYPGKFDVIVSSSSNTFAALASGAFALSENYLFTTEAFEDFYRALAPGGLLLMEHQFYIPRAVGEVQVALTQLGVEDPAAHFAAYELPKHRRMILVLSNEPLTDEIRGTAIGPLSEETFEWYHLVYPAPEGLEDHLVNRIALEGWRAVAPDAPYDIRPCPDNRPFVAQMGLWKNVEWDKMDKVLPYEFYGFPLSRLILLTILAVIAVLVLPLLFLPRFFKGPRLGAGPWLYFFSIGVGFMVVEVVLIQQFTLLIGSSAYTFVVILTTLLLASGIGSFLSVKLPDWIPFLGILLWLVLDFLLFQPFVGAVGGMGGTARLLASVLVLAPLGICMGMPFPKAALRVGEAIDWGFAVNGVASVLGSASILLVSMQYGFRVALAVGAAWYMLALLLFSVRRFWAAGERVTG